MAKEKEKKKAGKSRSAKIRQIAQKGVAGLDNVVSSRAGSQYLKYGDVVKVSDVDVRESVGAGRRTYSRDSFGASGWANRLYTTGGKPAGTKFRHGGKTYRIVAGTPATAELVTT